MPAKDSPTQKPSPIQRMIGSLIVLGTLLGVQAGAEPMVAGQVRLASGEPVAGAQVRLFDLSDLQRGAIARALTDGTGYFALPLAALSGRALPERFALGPNYPNPFNPSTIIPYQLAASSEVQLEVFNVLGQHIATLVDGERPAGFHTAMWHATDAAGRAVGAGVYIYRMTVGVEHQTGRMVLLDGQAGVSAGGIASVWPGASGGGGPTGEREEYGLIVSGSGLVPYVDSAFRVEAGMAPVELVVSAGPHSAGKAPDDPCAFCDLFDALNDEEEEEGAGSGKAQATLAAPAAPTNLRFEAVTDSSCRVRWDAAEGAADYDVNYKRAVGGKWTNEPHKGIRLYNTIYDLAPNTEYRWAVRAENSDGPSEWAFGPNFTTLPANRDGQQEGQDSDVVTIPDAKLRAAIAAALDKARGATITKDEMKALTELEAIRAGIGDLTGLEYATNLTDLSLFGNDISDISVLRGLTNLTVLDLGSNDISDISVLRGLTNLIWLSLSYNDISDVSVLRGLTNLEELSIRFNDISDISVLRGLTKLRVLWIGSMNISDISVLRGLTNLTALYLSYNDISDISVLRGLTNLIVLGLEGNDISDISVLRGLTELRVLWIALNNISDVSPLRDLTKLERLDLAYNNISDVSPLRDLTKLTELDLWGNLLSDSSINDHIPALQSRGAIVSFHKSFRTGDFDIELVFLGSFTESHKNVFRYVARRWMSVVTEDLPDYEFTQGWSDSCGDHSFEIPAGERIDDLRIYITNLDGDGFILGFGGPSVLRETTHLPVVGCMGVNLFRASIPTTARHELGHVLGFGSIPIWEDYLSWGPDVHFNGPLAVAAFDDAGGRDYTGAKVPVDDGSHWRYSVLEGELMVPYGGGALSAITVQALADMGYGVDVTQADPYTLPGAASAKVSATIAAALPLISGDNRLRRRLESTEEIGARGFDFASRDNRLTERLALPPHAEPKRSCGVGTQRKLIYVVDQQGRIIRTINRKNH